MISLLIPSVFLFLIGIFLGMVGRSYLYVKCNQKGKRTISLPLPWYEMAVGFLFSFLFSFFGGGFFGLLLTLYSFVLLELALLDFITFEIPFILNFAIFLLGIFRLFLDLEGFLSYLEGFFLAGGLGFLLYFFTKGRALGGGDVKLVAVSGFFLGYQGIFWAVFIAFIFALIVQGLKILFFHSGRVFALGPYLAMGCFVSLFLTKQ